MTNFKDRKIIEHKRDFFIHGMSLGELLEHVADAITDYGADAYIDIPDHIYETQDGRDDYW